MSGVERNLLLDQGDDDDDDDDDEAHHKDFAWHQDLLESHNYTDLVHYLELTQFNGLPNYINYPQLSIVQVLLTIATVSPHYYHLEPSFTDDDNSLVFTLGVRAMAVLGSLLELLQRDDDDDDDDDDLFQKPIPSQLELQNLKVEMFKVLKLFEGDDEDRSFLKRQKKLIIKNENENENGQEEINSSIDDSDDDHELKFESPLKKQLDLLLENLFLKDESTDDDDDDDDNNEDKELKLKSNFKRKWNVSENNKTNSLLLEDETIFGNKLLYKQIDQDFWKLLRWSFKNSSSCSSSSKISILKSEYIWQTWRPIILFFTNLITLQFNDVYENILEHTVLNNKQKKKKNNNNNNNNNNIHVIKLMLQQMFITKLIKNCSLDERIALDEFVSRIFINEKTMNTDYITPIYSQELKNNHHFVMVVQDDDDDDDEEEDYWLKLGKSSMQIRKQFLYLGFRYINIRFQSVKDSNFYNSIRNSRENVLDGYYYKLQSFLIQLNYNELNEFFIEDSDKLLNGFKLEFLAQLCFRLLQYYSNFVFDDEDDYNIDDDTNNTNNNNNNIDVMDILHDETFQKLSILQLNCDPFNHFKSISSKDPQNNFNHFHLIYKRIVLFESILINFWFKLNPKMVNGCNSSDIIIKSRWNFIIFFLQKGDKIRLNNLNQLYLDFQQQKKFHKLKSNDLSLQNYDHDDDDDCKLSRFKLVSLNEMFMKKFGRVKDCCYVDDGDETIGMIRMSDGVVEVEDSQ